MSDIKDLQRQIAELNGAVNRMAGDTPVVLFKDFAGDYLRAKLNHPSLRPSTKVSFENQTRNHLIPFFGALPLEKVNNAEWLHWIAAARSENKITRFFNARKCLTEIMRAAREDGHIQKIPKFDNPDSPKDVGRALADLEILRILKHCRSKFFRFLFYVFWKMGCRPREICQWEWSMFTWNEPGHTWIEIPARISKTDRTRRIPVNPNVSRRLWRQYSRGFGSPFVFPRHDNPERPQISYHSHWNGACRRAKISAVPYDLRRTFITRCAADGKPLIYVSKLLDTSVKMVESVYAKSDAKIMEEILK